MNWPSFSVVITCYNQSVFIEEAVNSVLNQTLPATQVIVVDDASTDTSVDRLSQYEQSITLITRRDNGGPNAARNLGASRARGDYFVFLDGDDVLVPWALELYAYLVIVKTPKIILAGLLYFQGSNVLGSPLYVRYPDLVVSYEAAPTDLAIVDYTCLMTRDRTFRACASAIVVERQAFQGVNGWTEGVFPAEDYDLMLKLGYSGRSIQIESPATVCYRVHADNTMRQVARCTAGLRNVIQRARNGVYTNGGHGRLDAYALLGGAVFFWLKNAFRARCYVAALGLLSFGLPMLVAAVLRRLRIMVSGQRSVDVLPEFCCGRHEGKHFPGGTVV